MAPYAARLLPRRIGSGPAPMSPREIQAVLAWSALPGVGERTLLALQDHARESRQGLADLWTTRLDDLARLVPLEPRTRSAMESGAAGRWRRAEEEARVVRDRGVDVLLRHDPHYPEALRAGRPRPVVFAYGALPLLEEPRVALVSSRTVTHAGLSALDALADALARRDVPLVTSTNRESYRAAAVAAKRHAGPTVFVVDRGLAEAFPTGFQREPVAPARVWDEALDPDLQLLLSPFGWTERWSPRAGPRRDSLIFDLADALVATEIRPGGNIERECRAALERGRTVLLLNLPGREPPPGLEGAERLSWRGGDATAEEVLGRLPTLRRAAAEPDRALPREVAQFLARACEALDRRSLPPAQRVVGASPADGPLRTVAAAWGSREGGGPPAWLLADLAGSGPEEAGRVTRLLERVGPGGFLAALVPAGWLEDGAAASQRDAWLRHAALRVAVRLPRLPALPAGPAAVVVLERSRTGGAAALFAPERAQMGRFHLRRYLQEVLASLASAA